MKLRPHITLAIGNEPFIKDSEQNGENVTVLGSGRGGRSAAKLPNQAARPRGYIPNTLSRLFLNKFSDRFRTPLGDPGGRPPGPEPGFEGFEIQGKS